MEHILKGLNEKQQDAVRAIQGPVLVISGPGSGKTRCLTHRIAYLIAHGIPPASILAVTFTNKAAKEIGDRVRALMPAMPSEPAMGTFHSICLRILRVHAHLVGYRQQFTIADRDDQLSVVKSALAELELDPKQYVPAAILSKISKLKTSLITPDTYAPKEHFEKIVGRVFRIYQDTLLKAHTFDFDDLISVTVRLLKEHPDILERYQKQWHYILVDEYQDTSHNQYQLVTMLAAQHRNIFCIGDDAQSIYLFRDADIRNILNFQKEYPDANVILLEQNYRSTKNIIAAAQHMIAQNASQIPKELWTANTHGEPISIREAINERDEGFRVADNIQRLLARNHMRKDIAVLYRTHAQSRPIEEALITTGIPYRMVGGLKFYDRREIRDILAYLKVAVNPADLVSFERIANVPARGIGGATIQHIIRASDGDLIVAAESVAGTASLTPRAVRSITQLAAALSGFADAAKNLTPSALIGYVSKTLGYEAYLRATIAKTSKEGDERMENVRELVSVAQKFDSPESSGLAGLLEHISLLQETDRLREDANSVTLMTIHSSKGLEFPVVFVVGMEEGLFPHNRTLASPHELEEERRLCYVAITRAKERLFLSYARFRRMFGSTQSNIPSRFLGEIPEHLIKWERQGGGDEEVLHYDV
ncbi:MAG: UvrD-helicase domain-containing protein [Patescibacteria group bacterium]